MHLQFMLLLIIISSCANLSQCRKHKKKHSASEMNHENARTCEEFSKNARFNPYSVLDDLWFVFYYWAPPMGILINKFVYPSSFGINNIKQVFDGEVVPPVNWSSRVVVMCDNEYTCTLLVEQNDRGLHLAYAMPTRYKLPKDVMQPREVVLKQTADNKILGYMECSSETVLAMSRLNEVPPQNRLLEEASRLNFYDRQGKSYLYRGHDWMPVGEADEKGFWDYRHKDISIAYEPKFRADKEQPNFDAKDIKSRAESESLSYISENLVSLNRPQARYYAKIKEQNHSNSSHNHTLRATVNSQQFSNITEGQHLFHKLNETFNPKSSPASKNHRSEDLTPNDEPHIEQFNFGKDDEEYLLAPEEQPLIYQL